MQHGVVDDHDDDGPAHDDGDGDARGDGGMPDLSAMMGPNRSSVRPDTDLWCCFWCYVLVVDSFSLLTLFEICTVHWRE